MSEYRGNLSEMYLLSGGPKEGIALTPILPTTNLHNGFDQNLCSSSQTMDIGLGRSL